MAAEDKTEMEALAGEYVLGTLDAVERVALAARIERDPLFKALVQEWEGRLGTLAEAVVPVAPPDHLRGAIRYSGVILLKCRRRA